jgi:hypothetical protein
MNSQVLLQSVPGKRGWCWDVRVRLPLAGSGDTTTKLQTSEEAALVGLVRFGAISAAQSFGAAPSPIALQLPNLGVSDHAVALTRASIAHLEPRLHHGPKASGLRRAVGHTSPSPTTTEAPRATTE